MKTSEFIQVINATTHISRHIKINDIVLQIDTLRKLHVRLQNACEYLLLDPNSFENTIEREKIKKCAIEIREFANEYKIQVNFEKLGNDWASFSKQHRDEKQFAKYHYNNIDITNLIVFVEKRKQKPKSKPVEALQQSNFELENDFVVLDENGNDLNKISGVDL